MNEKLFEKLEKRRLNFSHYYILEELIKGHELSTSVIGSSPYCTLERKGFLVGDALTGEGEILFKELSSELKTKKLKIKRDSAEYIPNQIDFFEEWWKEFPTTDRIWDGDNIKFQETRGLRTGKKDKCKDKYIEILSEGAYSHKELLNALKYEVDMRVEQSLKGVDNKLTFMKGALTYLNNNAYESFIDIAKIKRKPNSKSDTVII